MSRKNKEETLFSKDFILTCVLTLFTGICMQMLNSNLAPFANDTWGSKTLGGYLTTVFNIGSIGMAFFSGRLVDTKGRRNCLVFASALFGFSTLTIAFWPTPAVALTVRLIEGFGKGLVTVATAAIVSDIIPRSRMSEGMGLYGLGGTLSMAFGPMLALALTADKNYSRMFIVCAGSYLLAGVFGIFIDYEKKRKLAAAEAPAEEVQVVEEKSESDAPAREYKGIWKLIEKAAIPASINYTICFGSYAAILVFITVYGQEVLQLPGTKISLFYTVAAITMLIARLTMGKLADRRGALTVLVPAHMLVWVMFLILIFVAPKYYLGFLLAGAVYGFCNATIMPVFNAIAITDSPRKRNGTASATFAFVMDFGILAASALFGPVIDAASSPAAGYRKVFFISIGINMVSLLLCVLLFNNKTRAKRREKLCGPEE